MARIYPFHAYRYTPQAGRPEDLITQPYDKISPEMQRRYLGLSPHNLVRVILGERQAADNAGDNVYTRAAAHLKSWIEGGVLARDAGAAFYPYYQEFEVPDSGETLLRKGFIGLGEVAPYTAGIVFRHERTLSGPKKDRMQVLEHTGAHFGQLFMLYADPRGEVEAVLDEAMRQPALTAMRDEYGTRHTLGRIGEAAAIARLQELLADKKLLIADGHHRYETALAYAEAHPEARAAQAVMMTFVNMHSPGLRILATHRVVSNLAGFHLDKLKAGAGRNFTLQRLESLAALERAWAEPHAASIRIGVAAQGDDGIWLLEKQRGESELDVAALHTLVLDEALGITAEAVRDESYLRYVRGAGAALQLVREGGAQAAFLLQPPTIEQVAAISFGGGVMPQKSTDFYPKLLSGMAIYRLADGFTA